MKSSTVRALAALVITLGLAGCGGKATFDVTGTVTGLFYSGLVLSNNSDTVTVAPPPSAAGGTAPFVFPNAVSYGTTYNVAVQTNPLHETCLVSNGTDAAGHTASIDAIVSCTTNTYAISGTVSGFTGDTLELANGSSSDTVLVASGATSFAFVTTVPYNAAYGVTVLTQPTTQNCTVVNGTGVMQDAAVTNVQINCVDK